MLSLEDHAVEVIACTHLFGSVLEERCACPDTDEAPRKFACNAVLDMQLFEVLDFAFSRHEHRFYDSYKLL